MHLPSGTKVVEEDTVQAARKAVVPLLNLNILQRGRSTFWSRLNKFLLYDKNP